MDVKDLRPLLERVRSEIEHTDVVDEKGRDLLLGLEADVRGLLDRSMGRPPQLHPARIQHLEEAIRHFELTHPTLTSMLVELLQTLSSAGI